jgi:hypothetical protein
VTVEARTTAGARGVRAADDIEVAVVGGARPAHDGRARVRATTPARPVRWAIDVLRTRHRPGMGGTVAGPGGTCPPPPIPSAGANETMTAGNAYVTR